MTFFLFNDNANR